MRLNKPNSKFYRWWNSYTGRRVVSAAYSLGASIVILGAMFKIIHLPMGNVMLGIGMSVESLIFALGVFDKPFREYDWTKIFNFKADEEDRLDLKAISDAVQGGVQAAVTQPLMNNGNATPSDFLSVYNQSGGNQQPAENASGMIFNGILNEDDVKNLSDGIKNLTVTAENLQKLADIALAANGLAKNIESASEMAANFADTQQKLNSTAETLANSYHVVNTEMENVASTTRTYSGQIEGINRNITSINSLYEIQLRAIQNQADNLKQQAEAIKKATEQIDGVSSGMDKMKEAVTAAQAESHRYQNAARKLADQVEDLNAIYGNMLNALS